MHRFESVCGLIRFVVGVLCLLDLIRLVEIVLEKWEYVGSDYVGFREIWKYGGNWNVIESRKIKRM